MFSMISWLTLYFSRYILSFKISLLIREGEIERAVVNFRILKREVLPTKLKEPVCQTLKNVLK